MVNKLFTLTNILILILIIFSTLLLLSNDISKIKGIIPFLKFYQKNQSSKLIHSIAAVDPKEDCPKNSFPLSLYTYPGTSKGCLISNITLKKDSCSIWSKIFKSTDEIEETDQKTFDTIFSKKLCVFSYNENNYTNNIINNDVYSLIMKIIIQIISSIMMKAKKIKNYVDYWTQMVLNII